MSASPSDPPPTQSTEGIAEQPTLLTRDFLAVCFGQFFGFAGNGLVGPVFPLYMVVLGFSETVIGLFLATFSVVSLFVRPYYGYLADTGRPRRALNLSGVLLAISPLGYISANPIIILFARGLHGIGWAGLSVAGSSWVAYLAPVAQRAEALGYYTMVQRIGLAVGPVAGLWLVSTVGYRVAFAVAAACGIFVTLSNKVATTPDRSASEAKRTDSGPWYHNLFETSVVLGGAILVINIIPTIMVNVFMPLYFEFLELEGIELYFAAIGIMGIVSRGVVGKWADRMGRMWSVAGGFAVQLAGLLFIALGTDSLLLTTGGVIWIFGSAVSQPSLYAVAIDTAPANRRGVAMSSYTMSFQIGSGISSIIGGLIAEHFGYSWLNWFCVATAVFGLLVVLVLARGWDKPQ